MSIDSAVPNHAIALVWLEFEADYPRDLALQRVNEAFEQAGLPNGSNLAEAAVAAAHAERLVALFSDVLPSVVAKNSMVWLNAGTVLQCRRVGALLWVFPDASGRYAGQQALALLQSVAIAQGWSLWQVVHDSEQPLAFASFDLPAIALRIDLAQADLGRAQQLNQQRRTHVIGIAVICFVLSVAGLWFAKDKPWQAFLIAVIYSPLLIAAVLTVLLVAQRLKAAFLARFP